MALRIVVNTRFLLKKRLEGLGRFTFETMKRWVRDHPDVEFHFLFDRPFDPSFVFGLNVTPVVLYPPARHPLLWKIWFDYSVAGYLKRIKPNLFVSPDGYLSLRYDGPQLPVIHDLAFEHKHHGLPPLVLKYYQSHFPKFAKMAKRIATVSAFSADDIAAQYGIETEKIDVVYNGAAEIFTPLSDLQKHQIRDKHTAGRPFFLFVGALHPRKNIANLLMAFDRFKKSDLQNSCLMIAGRKAWNNAIMESIYENMAFKKDVIFADGLNDTNIANLTASAIALVNVSWFEGFGLPVLEAMQCGTPVICTANSALHEVAGTAALTVNPGDPEEIALAMKRISEDRILWHEMHEKGLARAGFYSWDKTADLLWKSAMKCLDKQ